MARQAAVRHRLACSPAKIISRCSARSDVTSRVARHGADSMVAGPEFAQGSREFVMQLAARPRPKLARQFGFERIQHDLNKIPLTAVYSRPDAECSRLLRQELHARGALAAPVKVDHRGNASRELLIGLTIA